ncbi:MAG: TIGR03067 domain-containing protein [Planctomycetota bacterium]|nr:MAG: TIGR03067 domain-containing protein [Planctomycetota bacterium]
MATLAMLTAALLLAPANDDAAAQDDLARMQGDWMVESMKLNGLKHDQTEAESLFRTVQGDKYTVSRYTRAISSGHFTLDPTQSPKTIDSTPDNSPDGVALLGIYEFDGTKLRICNAPAGKPRPKDFKCRLGSQHTLIVWEPEK